MKRLTEIWLFAFGLVCAGIGLAHLLFGTGTIIGGGRVNATIDSDMRFYALLFTAFGLLLPGAQPASVNAGGSRTSWAQFSSLALCPFNRLGRGRSAELVLRGDDPGGVDRPSGELRAHPPRDPVAWERHDTGTRGRLSASARQEISAFANSLRGRNVTLRCVEIGESPRGARVRYRQWHRWLV
jgi:hypothetical protein